MKYKIIYVLFLTTIQFNLFAQDWTYRDSTSNEQTKDWADKEERTNSLFFIGLNVGGYFPNRNTTIIYTGTNDVTDYGINYILNVPQYKTLFDTYFQYPYSVEELPLNPSYKNSFNVGLHTGLNLGNGHAIFLDINTTNLSYEQSFTIAIDDPTNKSVDPTYEQIPIIGKENCWR